MPPFSLVIRYDIISFSCNDAVGLVRLIHPTRLPWYSAGPLSPSWLGFGNELMMRSTALLSELAEASITIPDAIAVRYFFIACITCRVLLGS